LSTLPSLLFLAGPSSCGLSACPVAGLQPAAVVAALPPACRRPRRPRRPATCVPGTRPAPRFKSGGAHQTAVRRAPSPAAPRACSTRPHATWARTKNSTPGPHPQSTPTRTRAQHSRTHTHTHTHTHGAWHTAHVAGRAGGRARRVGASGGTSKTRDWAVVWRATSLVEGKRRLS